MARVVKRSAAEATKTCASRARQDAPSPLPRWIPHQLCQPVEIAPSGPQWLHEIKLDGFRVSVRIEGGRAQLLTRTGLDSSDKYPSVVATLAKVAVKSAYLEANHAALGTINCRAFRGQAASDGERGVRLVYYVFDLLHLDGRDTASLPLRRAQGVSPTVGRRHSRRPVQRPRDGRRRAYPQACMRTRVRGRRFQDGRCTVCARKQGPVAQIQMPQSPGVRCRRLDRPGRIAPAPRRAFARLLRRR